MVSAGEVWSPTCVAVGLLSMLRDVFGQFYSLKWSSTRIYYGPYPLKSVYFCAMVDNWKCQCPQAGVTFYYCHGRKLIGDHTPKSHLLQSYITESKFA